MGFRMGFFLSSYTTTPSVEEYEQMHGIHSSFPGTEMKYNNILIVKYLEPHVSH